jgi:hypothetical protein
MAYYSIPNFTDNLIEKLFNYKYMKTSENYPGKLQGIHQLLKRYRIPYKIIFLLMGIASTVWFFVRVIPKPSRISYRGPCDVRICDLPGRFIIHGSHF